MKSSERILSLDTVRSALSGPCACDILNDHCCNFDNVNADDVDTYRRAAVLVVIYGEKQLQLSSYSSQLLSTSSSSVSNFTSSPMRPIIIMTVKPMYLNIHAGEISFPGGKVETDDRDILHTALRETREEIGLYLKRNQIIGRLCSVRTLNSKFVITPFVSVISERPVMTPNSEVHEILEMPLDSLLGTSSLDVNFEHNATSDMYTFEHNATRGKKIWGASARILKQIDDILNP